MNRRGRRSLSAEERSLWSDVARSVRPLAGRTVREPEPSLPAPTEPKAPPKPPPKLAKAPPRAPAAKAPAPKPPAPPPLAPLERRVVRALARGQTRAEATIDLHGLTQAQAHGRLLGFLNRAQSQGQGLVLVITGRGREGEEGRGVLRRMVPHWLGAPELRNVVVGFQEAGTRQGGAGALYVRLRRPRA